jgi:hypothetical protein
MLGFFLILKISIVKNKFVSNNLNSFSDHVDLYLVSSLQDNQISNFWILSTFFWNFSKLKSDLICAKATKMLRYRSYLLQNRLG